MISFIVPIYNAEYYLTACIESLLHQTERDLQIILVDDGSTDSSLAIAQTFAKQDKRIVVLQQPHAGQSAARNLGLQHIKGEFIAFVDADDTIESNWCERHLKAIDGVDYVQSGYKRVVNGEVKKPQLPKHRYQFTSPCMRLYRRKAIENILFAEGYIYEDVLFSTDLWISGASCRMINYSGYLYTQNPNSTTSTKHPEAQKKLYQALREKYKTASSRGKWIILLTIFSLKLHFLHI